ncbi:MAG TPA: IS982 family transposase [Dehalococcoidia bacterium]|jgi:IS5 family transposase|nr:IS982 family transposase [Dehalococcoidia bacterium]
MLSYLPLKDKLTILFCLVADFLALLSPPALALPSGTAKAGRHPNLTAAEVLTLALFRFWMAQRNWKAYYNIIAAGFRQEFPNLPCYETLLRQINTHGASALLLLMILLGRREGPGTYALDATALPVSRHRRSAKVTRPWAAWGKDSDGHWFFGFKLHAVCDPRGRLTSLRITPGNVADITQAEALLSQLQGLVVADAAYVSATLRQKLWDLGVLLLTPLRKNMKGLASLEQMGQLKGRSIIETVFSVIKERLGLVTSLPRSLDGYLVHYILVLLAYQLGRWVAHALNPVALP